jgi:hypothetical protein
MEKIPDILITYDKEVQRDVENRNKRSSGLLVVYIGALSNFKHIHIHTHTQRWVGGVVIMYTDIQEGPCALL